MPTAFFVAGTDTEVGKTYVTCGLLRATRQLGFSTVGMKPIAAGVEADGRNQDVAQLLAASSIKPPLEWINPFLYAAAIAPHIAAREAGMEVLGISLVTNHAAGFAPGHLNHAEVLEAGRAAGPRISRLLADVITRIDKEQDQA